MFSQHSSLPSSKGSPISQALSMLASAGGIAAAILLTPLAYGLTQAPLHSYLSRYWGPDLAAFLSGTMGVIEAIVIFVLTKLLISIAATAAIVGLAARRVPFS